MSLDERENTAVERSDEGLLSSSETELITSPDDVDKETQILSSNNDGENSDDDVATDDESAEQKEMTVTNLKVTFEHLSQLTPDAKDKPNWWIRQNSKGEYIIYSSSGRPSGPKEYRKLSDPEKFLKHIDSQQIRVVDDGDDKIRQFRRNTDSNSDDNNDDISNQSDDKTLVAVSNGSLDLHELCTTDSSSEEERSINGTTKETEEDEAPPDIPKETVSEVDNAQEAGETFETDKISNRREILSIISNKRSSNQSGSSMNLETLREKDKRQLSNVVQELIQTEKNYVSSLERGIKIYVHTLDTYARNYPALLGKKYHIFGNIERLCAFHKEELLPSLIACNDDVVDIANLFYTFITKDYFYGYVLFGLNKPRAEKLTSEYKEFFDGITKESKEDKLGVNSFLLQPIQILPRYKLLFGEVIKALANDIDGIKNVKDELSACCIAEKQIQRLLDNVNEALSMNDIEEIHEFDLLEQGKFKKMSEFTMFDSDVGRRFKGKAFLFEQTLLCTESIEKTGKLQYRTHIILDDVMFIDTDNKDGFKVITANNKETDFFSNLLVIQDWIKLLTPMDEKGVIIRSDIKVRNCGTVSRANSIFSSISSHDKSTFSRNKLSSNTVRVTKREKLLSDIPPRVESIISNASTKSNRSSSSSQDSYDLGGTIWYVSLEDYSSAAPSPAVKTSDQRKHLDTLRNIEKHYILLLTIHKHGYLRSIPSYISINIREFIATYDLILEFHFNNIYPMLAENGMDIVYVCNLFKKCLQDPVFQKYKNYAILAPLAYETLNSYYINAAVKPGTHMDIIDQSLLQDLEKFIELPILQLRKYKNLLSNLMRVMVQTLDDQHEDIPVEVTRYVANVIVELENFERLVNDNYKIHSKPSFYIKVKNLGLIQYSDLVVMEYDDANAPRHRIFLMDTAVLAVRTRKDPKDEDNEIFDSFIWSLPYELVQYRHSIKIGERIKIFSKSSKYQQYSVIFRSGEKKREFLRRLEDILEKHNNFTTFFEND